jgi:peptidoglycan/xylan/chitin deacetylase (PgdA/CDA1 family)
VISWRKGPIVPESKTKRAIKAVLSSAVWVLDRGADLARAGRGPQSKAVVLLYHDVADSEVAAFERHVSFLRRRYDVLPLAELHTSASGSRPRVSLTFDDALASFGSNAISVLAQHSTPATLFVPSGLIAASEPGYMTPDAVKALPPYIEVGSHSRLHRRLSTLDDAELGSEVAGSKVELEEMLGRPVSSFAFPFGDTNARVEQHTAASGYDRTYSVRPGTVTQQRHGVPRTTLEPSESLFELRLKADGAYRWMGVLMAARRRFLGHNV